MDLIGICSTGLAAGVDKWCGKYSPVFRAVCIGRMVGNMIDSYSETMLHFYPSDKRVLYKAHSIRGRKGIDELDELARAINSSFEQDEKDGKSIPKDKVIGSQLSYLMSAASTISADAMVGTGNSDENEGNYSIYDYTLDPTGDTESKYIENETTDQMIGLARELPLVHRKVLFPVLKSRCGPNQLFSSYRLKVRMAFYRWHPPTLHFAGLLLLMHQLHFLVSILNREAEIQDFPAQT